MNLVVPASIRSDSELRCPKGMGESEALTMFKVWDNCTFLRQLHHSEDKFHYVLGNDGQE